MKTTSHSHRRSGRRLIVAAALGFAAFALPAFAQGQTPVLTLEEAQDRATRNNPAYRRTTNDLTLSGVEMREAWQTLLPRVSLTLLQPSMSWNLQRVGQDNFGNPIENPEARMIQSAQARQSGRLSMTFDVRNYLNLRGQREEIELNEEAAEVDLIVLRGSVTRSFLTVQEAQMALELDEALLEDAIRNQEAVEVLYALAQVDRLDLLNAGLDVAAQEAQTERSRANLQNAYISLRNLIGDTSLDEFTIEAAPLREFDPASLDDGSLLAIALSSNPQIRQQENALAQSRRSVRNSRFQWLPTASLSFATSRNELSRGAGDAFYSLSPDGGWERQIGFSITFPDLGNFFTYQGNTRRAQVTEQNQGETVRETRMTVEQQVRTQIVDLRLAHRSLEIQEDRAALAEEAWNLSLESYRMGGGSFQEVQNASTQAATARRQALEARHALERALIDLEETLGVPLAQAGVRTSTGE